MGRLHGLPFFAHQPRQASSDIRTDISMDKWTEGWTDGWTRLFSDAFG